jgi:hypothetical protein
VVRNHLGHLSRAAQRRQGAAVAERRELPGCCCVGCLDAEVAQQPLQRALIGVVVLPGAEIPNVTGAPQAGRRANSTRQARRSLLRNTSRDGADLRVCCEEGGHPQAVVSLGFT